MPDLLSLEQALRELIIRGKTKIQMNFLGFEQLNVLQIFDFQ